MPSPDATTNAIPDNLRDIIERWFQETLRFGPIAQNTQAYNQATIAKDKLLDLLAGYSGVGPALQPTNLEASKPSPIPPAPPKPAA